MINLFGSESMPASMAAVAEIDGAVLKKFAQKLAGNEKKYRDRGVKMLRKWLSSRSETANGGLAREDFLKIWKGLHYCMWMSDKPIAQEELAVNISKLVHSLSSPHAAVAFTSAFFVTESREWFNIDRLRLDKFMMLIRKCVHEMFVFLSRQDWSSELVAATLSAMCDTVIHPTDDTSPDGLKLHVADLYVAELTRVGAEQLSEEQVATFLDPYCIFLAKVKSKVALKHVVKEVFFPLVGVESDRLEREKEKDEKEKDEKERDKKEEEDEQEEEEEKEEPSLKVDFQVLADRLFALASSDGCRGKNRKPIYSLVKTFKNLAQGIPLEVHEVEGPPDKDPIDYNAALQRLNAFEKKLIIKTGKFTKPVKRKHEPATDANETAPDEEFEATSDERPKKKKKEEKVAQVNGFQGMNGLESEEQKEVPEVPTKKSKKRLKNVAKEHQATLTKRERKEKKRRAAAQGVPVETESVTVLNAQTEDSNIEVVTAEEAAEQINMTETRRTLKEMKKSKKKGKGTEAVLFTGGFVDSDEDNLAPSPTTKSKKKKKRVKNVEATDTSIATVSVETMGNGAVESEVFEDETTATTLSTQKKKKKVKKLTSEAICEDAVSAVTVDVKSKKSKKKGKTKKADVSEEAAVEEVEIFVPNKKYSSPLKAGFQKAMEDNLEDAGCDKLCKPFASFESGAKIPAAFVRKAMSKLKTPTSEPRKFNKSLQEKMTKKRRVSFGLEKNRAQDFAESLVPSPVVPFNPSITPDRTILKRPQKKQFI